MTTGASSISLDGNSPESISDLQGCYRSLAARIRSLLDGTAGTSHVVGVTSCGHGEGVSTVAANLACCAPEAYEGPTLLIDANFERPSQANHFGARPEPGLTDVLAGSAKLEACLQQTSNPLVKVLPTGTRNQRSPQLGSGRGRQLLESLRSDFRLIVIDLPPCDDDGTAAVKVLDGFLLVIESEGVRLQVARRAIEDLSRVGAKPLGAVLNKRKFHIPDWLYRKL